MKMKISLALVINWHYLAIAVSGAQKNQNRTSWATSPQRSMDMSISKEDAFQGTKRVDDKRYAAYSSDSFSPPRGARPLDESDELEDCSNDQSKSRRKSRARGSKSKSVGSSYRTRESHTSEYGASLDGIVVEPRMDYSQYSTLTSAISPSPSPSPSPTHRDSASSVGIVGGRQPSKGVGESVWTNSERPDAHRLICDRRQFGRKLPHRDVCSASSATAALRSKNDAKRSINRAKITLESNEISEWPSGPRAEAARFPTRAFETPHFPSWQARRDTSPTRFSATIFQLQGSERARTDWNNLGQDFLARNPYARRLLRKSSDYEGEDESESEGESEPFAARVCSSLADDATFDSKEGTSGILNLQMKKVKANVARKRYLIILLVLCVLAITIASVVYRDKSHSKNYFFGPSPIPVQPPSVLPTNNR